ncbi:MAG: TonB family protein [Bacteroidetes bacterium]|nr:TonB family protein [Bacteroidota bacterium]
MRKLFLLIAMMFSLGAFCQEDSLVYDLVEQMPQFPGGDDSMRHYLLYHLQYPEHSRNHNIEGRVDVRFLVDEYGNLKNIVVQKGDVRDLSAEALRVVRSFPPFTPGIHDGKAVKVVVVVPIIFLLADLHPPATKQKKKK